MIFLKDFCIAHAANKEIKKRMLTVDDWERIQQLLSVLQLFNKYVKILQSENVTLSDFFGFWTSLRIKLSKNDDELSQNLLFQMNEYHERLIKNPTLAAAVFLDPRYQRALKGDRETAIYFLSSLHRKIQENENFGVEQPETSIITNQSDDNESFGELEAYLNACCSIAGGSGDQDVLNFNSHGENKILDCLYEFSGVEVPLRTPVLEYWEKQRQSRPDLYKLASVIYAIPPTQSTVERAFSSLPIVLTSRRTNLGADCLQNILLVRLNKKHYE